MALLIKADGTEEQITPAGEDGHVTYDQVQSLVTTGDNGLVQHIILDPKEARGFRHAWMDEEGKLKKLPMNKKATKMSTYTLPDDTLCGDILFCTDEEDMH